jgi:hypothetical protein
VICGSAAWTGTKARTTGAAGKRGGGVTTNWKFASELGVAGLDEKSVPARSVSRLSSCSK